MPDKAPSGAQRRKQRVARGLPARGEKELAKERIRSKRRRLERQAATLAWLGQYKVEQGCADCDYNEHPAALDFDHVSADKVRGISRMLTCGRARLLAELQKCEVVCANCHRIRTYRRRSPGLTAAS